MRITVHQIALQLEAWAPPETAESYDNTGLQLGNRQAEVSRGLIALDLTPAVIEEARRMGANLIITHHPLFFAPIKAVTSDTLVGSMALRLAKLGIAHYAIHTNLDALSGGVSFVLAQQLSLRGVRFLQDRGSDPEGEPSGLGAMGTLPEPMTGSAFLQFVASQLGLSSLRHVTPEDATISLVAVCGGSGSSLIATAIAEGADAYVTADVKYHQFFDALGGDGIPRIAYLDVGHYESEVFTEDLLLTFLDSQFATISWSKTTTTTSPVRSFVPE
jgi:dinuclear metal center YbgI/SA1388 family protein